ncbi:MAG: hypothetical protein F7C07_01200 [Desulfurococcales archaeon]|nr:hypothetical protein [Desulfurococcales archaeon]
MEGRVRVLGTVESVNKAGYVVVRVENPGDRGVRPGVKVLLGSRPVGRLTDLIGNVDSPYAVVRLEKEPGLSPSDLVGSLLHYIQPLPRRPRFGRRRARGARRGSRRL